MWEHIKDYWELIFASVGTLIAGVSGFEHLRGRVGNLELISRKCGNLMTEADCDSKQEGCKELQALNHSNVIERLDNFIISQAAANKGHTDQYNMIMKSLIKDHS